MAKEQAKEKKKSRKKSDTSHFFETDESDETLAYPDLAVRTSNVLGKYLARYNIPDYSQDAFKLVNDPIVQRKGLQIYDEKM